MLTVITVQQVACWQRSCLVIEKSAQRRKHCALAVVRWSQKFSPLSRPPSQGRRMVKT